MGDNSNEFVISYFVLAKDTYLRESKINKNCAVLVPECWELEWNLQDSITKLLMEPGNISDNTYTMFPLGCIS